MFAIVFLWTPPHFWALAISYTNDYAAAGVPMLPVTRGAVEARKRSLVYAIVTVGISLALYLTGDVGLIYLATAAIFGSIFIWLAVQQIKLASVKAAMTLFKYSTSYLALIFVAMVADRLIPL
jgi:protoheme IX farnesyltransferase